MLDFDPETRPAVWNYHLAKQSILDLRAELEVLHANLRLLDKRNPCVVSLKANIVKMEDLISLKEANVLTPEAAVREARLAALPLAETSCGSALRRSALSSSKSPAVLKVDPGFGCGPKRTRKKKY